MQRIGIVGAGSWGTALAITSARAGRDVLLWDRKPAVAAAINDRRRNPAYLTDIELPPSIRGATDPGELADADALLLVTPAQTLRDMIKRLSPPPATPIVVCAKGIEQDTGKLLHEVIADVAPAARVAFLSGPTFAHEVAAGLPTAISLGCSDPELGAALTNALGSATFRPYANTDPVGVQLGGALKNVMAIACGIVEGKRLGENARAALVARGLAEMTRFAVALGAQQATLMGLSGLGDLSLSCFSRTSRNYDFGQRLGAGEPLSELLPAATVVEGVPTAAAVTRRASAQGLDMPICAAVDAIVHRGGGIDESILKLLSRPFRPEVTENDQQ